MKKIFTLFLIFIAILLSVNTNAQINRSNTKKSVPYRANYERMASGSNSYNTFEIREGKLWAWGRNDFGQLGDGTTSNKSTPIQIGTDNRWVSIATGDYHILGLKSDGTLWAWGDNTYGQLGDGTNTHRSCPVQIGTDDIWISIGAGVFHSLGLKSDGTLWSWGYNDYGQLGDGTTTNRSSPMQIGTDNKWVTIAAGNRHTLGLKSDGTLWAWGRNNYGGLGDGTAVSKNIPNQVGTDEDWVSITAGFQQISMINFQLLKTIYAAILCTKGVCLFTTAEILCTNLFLTELSTNILFLPSFTFLSK